MACCLPSICVDVGAPRELVKQGRTGYLVPGGDVGALIAHLRRLKNDEQLCARMGQAGRLRVEQSFSVDRMVARTCATYSHVLLTHGMRTA